MIRPALAKGAWVLADRFELSTLAYQGGGRKLDLNMISHLSSFCVQNIQPDLTIFLDVSPRKGLERAHRRGKIDRIEQESLSFFTDVYNRYHAEIKKLNNVVIVDACNPLKVVRKEICSALETYIETHESSKSN